MVRKKFRTWRMTAPADCTVRPGSRPDFTRPRRYAGWTVHSRTVRLSMGTRWVALLGLFGAGGSLGAGSSRNRTPFHCRGSTRLDAHEGLHLAGAVARETLRLPRDRPIHQAGKMGIADSGRAAA